MVPAAARVSDAPDLPGNVRLHPVQLGAPRLRRAALPYTGQANSEAEAHDLDQPEDAALTHQTNTKTDH